MVRVGESLSDVRCEVAFKSPKSNASRRSVSVPPFVVDELAQHSSAGWRVGAGRQRTVGWSDTVYKLPTPGLGIGSTSLGRRDVHVPRPRGRAADTAPTQRYRTSSQIAKSPRRCEGTGLWAHLDLNQGPHPYQGCALTELSYGPEGVREFTTSSDADFDPSAE